MNAEKRVKINSIINIYIPLGYTFCWTYIMITGIHRMFENDDNKYYLTAIIKMLIAKSNYFWLALFIIFEDKDVRNNFSGKKCNSTKTWQRF